MNRGEANVRRRRAAGANLITRPRAGLTARFHLMMGTRHDRHPLSSWLMPSPSLYRLAKDRALVATSEAVPVAQGPTAFSSTSIINQLPAL